MEHCGPRKMGLCGSSAKVYDANEAIRLADNSQEAQELIASVNVASKGKVRAVQPPVASPVKPEMARQPRCPPPCAPRREYQPPTGSCTIIPCLLYHGVYDLLREAVWEV